MIFLIGFQLIVLWNWRSSNWFYRSLCICRGYGSFIWNRGAHSFWSLHTLTILYFELRMTCLIILNYHRTEFNSMEYYILGTQYGRRIYMSRCCCGYPEPYPVPIYYEGGGFSGGNCIGIIVLIFIALCLCRGNIGRLNHGCFNNKGWYNLHRGRYGYNLSIW